MSKTSFEQRTQRRNRLLGLLRSESYWKTSALSERLNVSQRTLMRELAELKFAGFPIESDRGRGGGVRLSGRWGMDRLSLTHKEVVELILSLTIMELVNLPLLTGNLLAIRQKLFQAFPDKQREKVNNIRKRILISKRINENQILKTSSTVQAISENLSESFFRQVSLGIDYQSENGTNTTRQIEPHYIMLSWPVWYIVAWDHLRLSPRIFRIDRIQGARIIDTEFELRPELIKNDAYAAFYQNI